MNIESLPNALYQFLTNGTLVDEQSIMEIRTVLYNGDGEPNWGILNQAAGMAVVHYCPINRVSVILTPFGKLTV